MGLQANRLMATCVTENWVKSFVLKFNNEVVHSKLGEEKYGQTSRSSGTGLLFR